MIDGMKTHKPEPKLSGACAAFDCLECATGTYQFCVSGTACDSCGAPAPTPVHEVMRALDAPPVAA